MLEGKLCVLGLEDSFSDPILKAKHMKEKKTIKLLHHQNRNTHSANNNLKTTKATPQTGESVFKQNVISLFVSKL